MPNVNKNILKAIVYDLDGTIIYNDLTMDLCVLYLKERGVIGLLNLIFWAFGGRLNLKNNLPYGSLNDLDIKSLPYTSVLDIRLNCKAKAENIIIASGSHQLAVDRIAKNIGLSEKSIGSGQLGNLVGSKKAEVLKEKFGNDFAYVGNSSADIAVWKEAKISVAYNVTKSTIKRAKSQGVVFDLVIPKPSFFKPLLKSLRVHQWAKNFLLILPALLNIQVYEQSWIASLFFTFLGFSFVASSTYLVNDLLDISADRAHNIKKKRAFASGLVSIPFGAVAILTLVCLGLVFCSLSNLSVIIGTVFYAFSSLLYSFYMKKYALIDAMTLSFFYVLRVVIGAYALGLTNNIWFLCALAFFFLSLGLGKRAIELNKSQTVEQLGTTLPGRGYTFSDLNVVLLLGVGAAYTTILLVLIYGLISTQSIFTSEWSILAICAILFYWQARFWLLVQRNQINDDPVKFAVTDKVSLSVLSLLAIIASIEQIF